MADSNTINANQVKAVEALLTGATNDQAAQAAGVHVRTVQRWLTENAFCRALRQGQRQLLDSALRRLVSLESEITHTQRTIMIDKDAPPQVRLRASQLLRDGLYRGIEIHELTTATEILETANVE